MKDGFKVIDSELHLEEPLDLWEKRLPEPWRSRTKITPSPEGHLRPGGTRASFNGAAPPPVLGSSMIQRQAFRRWPDEPHLVKARTDCRPEVYIEGLDREGIDVAILTPTMTISLVRNDELEPEHALALCRVYNDWAYEFTQANPDRFKFWAYLPPHDAVLAAKEARRCVRELGAVGVASNQGAINGHLWCDDFFNPLWEELSDLKVPLGLHVSFGGKVRDDFFGRYAGHRRMEVVANTLGLGGFFSHTTVAEFITGAVFERYPELHLTIMESCVSWLPWLLWRMDEKWETFGQDAGYSLSRKPSDYWSRQCSAVVECEENLAKDTIAFGGDHNLLFSSDYPHHDSPFPHGVDSFLDLPDISAESKRKILWDNGARLFGLPVEEAAATR